MAECLSLFLHDITLAVRACLPSFLYLIHHAYTNLKAGLMQGVLQYTTKAATTPYSD